MRKDKRRNDELRPIKIEVGLLKNADGSALFKIGNTCAVAGVFGPREVHPKHEEKTDKAILRTRYRMSPFSTTERSKPGFSRRSIEISMLIRKALTPVLFLEDFPKTAIDVHIEIIEADASTRCAAINAASLALADAGVPMRDLVASCSAGKVNGEIVLDVAGEEDTEGEVDMPVAYYPMKDEITLIQMDGIATKDEIKQMLELAIRGCKIIYEMQRNALREKYEAIPE